MWKKVLLGLIAPLFVFGEIKAVIFSFGSEAPFANWPGVGAWVMHYMDLSKEQADEMLHRRDAFINRGGDEEEFWASYNNSLEAKIHPMWIHLSTAALPKVEQAFADAFLTAFYESMHNVSEMLTLIAGLEKTGYRLPLLCRSHTGSQNIVLSKGKHGFVLPFAAISGYVNTLTMLGLAPDEVILVDVSSAHVEEVRQEGGDAILFENPTQLQQELQQRGISF